MTRFTRKFIKKEYNSDLVVSEYKRMRDVVGLLESETIIFTKYLSKEKNILEAGCGTGRVLFGLYSLGYKHLTGLDVAPNMIKVAKEKARKENFNIKFFAKDICGIIWQKRLYDAVIMPFNSLMCIPDQKNRIKAIKNINNLLKKDGLFIFTSHIQSMNNFIEYFSEEKNKWKNAQQSENLIDFGDIENPNKFASFVHIADVNILTKILNKYNFEILEIVDRKDITSPNNMKKENLGDFMYFICSKEN